MKIGIFYICTGKYEKFFDDFFDSSEQFFLKHHEKHYYVFTESVRLRKKFAHNPRIHFVMQSHVTWPLDTLLRFWMFLQVREELENNDFLVFFNANTLFLENITDEEFLPNGENERLLACKHIYFDTVFRKNLSFTVPRFLYPYDRNKKSHAYIPYWKGF